MAGSLNKAIIIGNVGKDPEIRSTAEGKEIAAFSMATTDSWKDKATGERRERTEWHRVVIFSDALVGIVKNYVKKGSKLYIEGALKTRKWIDNGGMERYTTEISLQGFNSTLIILDNKVVDVVNNTESNQQIKTEESSNFDHNELDDEVPW